MSKVWPTLGSEGWITDPARMLNMSFAHTLTSDAIQSTIYAGEIISLTDIVVNNQHNPNALVNEIETQYTKFYKRLFDNAILKSSYTKNPYDSYSVTLAIDLEQNAMTYSLSYTAPLDNNSLLNTLKGITR